MKTPHPEFSTCQDLDLFDLTRSGCKVAFSPSNSQIPTSSSQTSPEEAMGTPRIQHLLILLVLGTSFLTSDLELHCQKGLSMTLEADPSNMFNWTTEEVETCDRETLCQETVLMIKAASTVSATLHCPTCVALGTCFSAPSLPCPNGTTRCYQGKLEITGGGIESSVEVRGCTAMIDCRLMSGILAVGPMFVREVCPRQLLTQSRKTENGATCLPIPVWGLQLLLPLLLPSFIHFS
ncbi:testis-expressed protein 101 isoform X3 [Cebus imitator]|uniref:testis-expressed protein 101 isoform X3 n=1 Tax=Cebus imitator TaxID=2715852 RepID=UPI00189AC628|nr:testis-expressed protein 101 isoform X3 [Cebus imitator]